ncbi:MAG: AraC family transcriptional regulator [Planctomycetota bacterium]
MRIPRLQFLHGSHRPYCISEVDKRFTYHTLQLMAAGSVRLAYDGEVRDLEGAWVWPAFPGPVIRFHEWPRQTPWDHRYIAFQGPLVEAWDAEGLLLAGPVPVPDVTALQMLSGLFDRLFRAVRSIEPLAQRRSVNLLERILLEVHDLKRRVRVEGAGAQWLALVLAQLECFDEEVDYPALAAEHAMSRSTLRRRFLEQTGMTPHHYRLQARAAEARRRLGETDQSIKTIAYELGYTDVHYFTRQFKQLTGFTPARFRETRQGPTTPDAPPAPPA